MIQPIVPTAVPIKLISTITTMNNSNPTTQRNNTLSLSNGMDGPTSSRFDIYQQNKIGSNEVSIRTLVPASISIENYRKALNAKICFRNILTLFITPSVSSSDFMTTVASYFRINMGSSERKVEGVVDSIRKDFLRRASNLPIHLGKQFKSQIQLIALRNSPILLFALYFLVSTVAPKIIYYLLYFRFVCSNLSPLLYDFLPPMIPFLLLVQIHPN